MAEIKIDSFNIKENSTLTVLLTDLFPTEKIVCVQQAVLQNQENKQFEHENFISEVMKLVPNKALKFEFKGNKNELLSGSQFKLLLHETKTLKKYTFTFKYDGKAWETEEK